MATTTMNISLPESLKTFVDDRLGEDGYGTASEYVRELIRDDQKRREEKKLEMVLLQRLKEDSDLDFDIGDIRAELAKRMKNKR